MPFTISSEHLSARITTKAAMDRRYVEMVEEHHVIGGCVLNERVVANDRA